MFLFCISLIHYSLRNISNKILFHNTSYAIAKKVPETLWDLHTTTHREFFLKELKTPKYLDKHKSQKEYLVFIKSSQQHYREVIQRLASSYKDIYPDLHIIAQKFLTESEQAQEAKEGSHAQARKDPKVSHKNVAVLCHANLIYLGDLSRYRETNLKQSNRNWAPATGYYDLARALYPESGLSYNQQAVIARVDGNDFASAYYFYRALNTKNPPATAQGNLDLLYSKFIEVHSDMVDGLRILRQSTDFETAFLGKLAMYHQNRTADADNQLEDQLMQKLSSQICNVRLKIRRVVLMNIAAWYSKGDAITQGNPTKSSQYLTRMNLKTFKTLLEAMLGEVERYAITETGPLVTSNKLRQILPGIKIYTVWLTSNEVRNHFEHVQSLVYGRDWKGNCPYAGFLNSLAGFWETLAKLLTTIPARIDVQALPSVDYLLEEDVDLKSFTRLAHSISTDWRSFNEVSRHHPNAEMLARVREFFITFLDHAVNDDLFPIAFDPESAVFRYNHPPLFEACSTTALEPSEYENALQVDKLVSEEASYEPPQTPTPTTTRSRPISLTHIPSIEQSPFAIREEDVTGVSETTWPSLVRPSQAIHTSFQLTSSASTMPEPSSFYYPPSRSGPGGATSGYPKSGGLDSTYVSTRTPSIRGTPPNGQGPNF
jgi:hypothetical protein